MGKSTPFLYQKRGVFYLQKRVPKKLVPKVGRAFVRVSLRTKDRATAIQTAGSILGALDKEWHAALFAIPDDIQVTGFLSAQQTTEPNLSDAAAAYIQSKGKYVADGCVVHSFRHSLRDRLRAVECPADIIDAIGGWTTEGIGHKYGASYDLGVKHRWMGRICKKYD